MSLSGGYIAFKLAYQVSPIILTRGIATALGGALPIVSLTESIASLSAQAAGATNGPAGLLSAALSSTSLSGVQAQTEQQLDSLFASYTVMPGGTLIQNQIAMYPFANQAIAANAIVAQPLNVSLLMTCPARGDSGMALKLATMISLQSTLSQHNNSGGTYSVVTPSYIYTDCLMTSMRDVSGGESKQVQFAWQLDFVQPLISLQAAQQALSGLMQKMTDGTPTSGTPGWSTGLAIGNPIAALQSSLVPQPALGPT